MHTTPTETCVSAEQCRLINLQQTHLLHKSNLSIDLKIVFFWRDREAGYWFIQNDVPSSFSEWFLTSQLAGSSEQHSKDQGPGGKWFVSDCEPKQFVKYQPYREKRSTTSSDLVQHWSSKSLPLIWCIVIWMILFPCSNLFLDFGLVIT